jgi:predicted TIM-barrel fold metal-dependent hydrolase
MGPSAGRCQFLKKSAWIAAVASFGNSQQSSPASEPNPVGGSSEDKAKMPAILDTHQHLWNLTQFRLPWIEKGSLFDRNYLMSDYFQATAGLNVAKAIYMEVDLDPGQQTAEADFIVGVCQKGNSPTVAAVISGRPATDGFRDFVTRFKGNKYIKGLRQVLHVAATPPGYCLDPLFIKGIRLLGELGMSFDICVRPEELGDAAKLVEACPDTRFILDHCGNGRVFEKDRAPWQRGMAQVARHANVVGKISGILASVKPGAWTANDLAPVILHTAEVFGKDRIMFGGDWPVCLQGGTYRQWVEALKAVVHDWREEDQRKLFHDNAARFYGLGESVSGR